MSWPLVTELTEHVAGQGGDPWQTLWRFEFKERQLSVPGFWREEFLGGGEPRLVNLSVWPWIPIHLLFGEPLSYNLIWIATSIFAGYSLFLLLRWLFIRYRVVGRYPVVAATMAGLLYMFTPYRIAQSFGHFGAMQTQWLPLALLLFFMLLERVTFWRLAGLALVVIAQAVSEHHYALWLLMTIGIILLIEQKPVLAWWRRKPGRWATVGMAAITFLVIGVVYWPTIRLAAMANDQLSLGLEHSIRFSADPFAYIIPAAFHSLWGTVSYAVFTADFTGNISESTHFLGFLPLLLVFFFSQRLPIGQRRLWFTVAAAFFVLSLGPRLHLLGRITPLPLPYTLIDSLPVINAVRTVARAGVLVTVAWSILFGWVLVTNLNRRSSIIYVTAAVLVEFLFIPLPRQSAILSPAYAAINRLPGSRLIELPATTNYTASSRALYASLTHGKEVVGNIALERGADVSDLKYFRSLPALRQLLYVRRADLEQGRTDFFNQNLGETLPEVMRYLDAMTILIHTDSFEQEQLESIREFLENRVGLKAQYFGDALLYSLDSSEQPRASDGIFLYRNDDWGQVTYDAARRITVADFVEQAGVTIVNTTAQTKPVKLSLAVPNRSPSPVQIIYQGAVQASIAPGATGAVTVSLTPGEHVVEFTGSPKITTVIENPQLQ